MLLSYQRLTGDPKSAVERLLLALGHPFDATAFERIAPLVSSAMISAKKITPYRQRNMSQSPLIPWVVVQAVDAFVRKETPDVDWGSHEVIATAVSTEEIQEMVSQLEQIASDLQRRREQT